MAAGLKENNVGIQLKCAVSHHVAAKCSQDNSKVESTLLAIIEQSAVFLKNGGTVDELSKILENKN
ncbi:MAG: hypothetical protein UU87_C0003G0159 [Parcubacteria group bacterium GW2011_GWA2_42_11]|nr:MAG: hypothetical protein UU87_C0003G0159 [Parcubacteria group bacterium GW2011_GWA2_42_11]KKT76489.1 MAG: hypothetical protein UW72_C0005G0057 [Parcubacteria group bacterium GW2011_GWF2_44_7]